MKQITVEHLYFSYDDEFILKDISFTLPSDAGCTLLVGKNGTGKSTLLNVVCDLMERDGGDVEREGVTIAYLPFDSPLYPHLTILENLRYFYRSFQGKDFDVSNPFVQKILQALSIDYLNQRFDKCSSGQQQKAGIACVLLSNADMIIMDEPFIAMDSNSAQQLIEIISDMKKKCAFLITTHTIDKLVEVCDRILKLEERSLVMNTTQRNEIEDYFMKDQHHAVQ